MLYIYNTLSWLLPLPSLINFRTDLNLCPATGEKNSDCVYLFRWTRSPIYLFMEPRILNDLAFNYLSGTEVLISRVHLAIPEICGRNTPTPDVEGNKWDKPVLLLNKLTTYVS